jgi:hypothetical protein
MNGRRANRFEFNLVLRLNYISRLRDTRRLLLLLRSVATRPDPAHVAPFLINRLAEARILSLALSLEQKSTFHDKCARVLQ